MKQAFLITAHRDPELVIRFMDQLDASCHVYLHLDSRQNPWNAWDQVRAHPRLVFGSQTFATKWGSHNILAASLHLLNKAYSKGGYRHFHLISGQDQLIQPVEALHDLSSNSPSGIFMEHFPLPFAHWSNGGLDRLQHWHFNKWFDNKKFGKLNQSLFKAQKMLSLQRKLPSVDWYGGSAWWSLSAEAAEHILHDYEQKTSIYHWLKFSLLPDEIYVATVLGNSDFAPNIQPSIRFIKWLGAKGKGSPKVLEMNDWDEILASKAYIARKFESGVSDELLERLNFKTAN